MNAVDQKHEAAEAQAENNYTALISSFSFGSNEGPAAKNADQEEIGDASEKEIDDAVDMVPTFPDGQ